ncbi:MAG: hypothetical protein UX38_C0004G0052 [Microgenomates group bacterium GW2011_GWC1_46_16]|nr:MAG: hypothetical protein UX38_C0004G0052 [Microgenomates group bacterium GW2011_GWC1_46_16]
MEAGGRGGSGKAIFSINGLIIGWILKQTFNVRGSGHGPELSKRLGQSGVRLRENKGTNAACDMGHAGRKGGGENNGLINLEPGTSDHVVTSGRQFVEEQDFNGSAGSFMAEQPGWEDFGVVDYQIIAGREKVREVRNTVVGDCMGLAVEQKEAG